MVDLGGRDKGNISLPQRLQGYTNENEGGGGEPRAMPTIINMQRTFYNIKIQDIQNKIDRLEKRNDELSEEIETIDEDNLTVETETAEEIANLTKQVSSQDSMIQSVKLRIKTIEDDRVKDKESFEEACELWRQKYKNEKVELVSQIKVLNARINDLEDFKKVQAGLEEKFKSNQEQILRNEENVDEILKDIKRKIEFDKEIVKNDMYECLFALAADFQLETSKFISLPKQRLMRENIMLKNVLLQTTETISSMMNAQINFKDSVIDYQRKLHSRLSTVRHNIIMDKVQGELLKRLRYRLYNLQQKYLSVNIPEPGAVDKCLLLIDHAKREESEVNFRFSTLKTLLHKERVKVNVAKYLTKTLGCKIKSALEAIYDLKYTVLCLLKCPYTRKDLQKLTCIELFLFLKDLLNKGQAELGSLIIKSLESIPRKLDAEEDLEKIHEPFDLEIIADGTEGSSDKAIFERIHLEKRTEISGEDAEEIMFDDRSLIIASIASTLPQSYEMYGEDEYEGELDITGE